MSIKTLSNQICDSLREHPESWTVTELEYNAPYSSEYTHKIISIELGLIIVLKMSSLWPRALLVMPGLMADEILGLFTAIRINKFVQQQEAATRDAAIKQMINNLLGE